MWHLADADKGFLSSEQKRHLAALFEAILPGGEKNPGATDAGAAEFLDRLLARGPDAYFEVSSWRTLYPEALAFVGATSALSFGGRLPDQLSLDETTTMLGGLCAGQLSMTAVQARMLLDSTNLPTYVREWLGRLAAGTTNTPTSDAQKKLFSLLRGHCIEGCFADQRWGGNRRNVMWQWYGYPSGPSVEFRRSEGGLPANPGPADAAPVSGNTASALVTP